MSRLINAFAWDLSGKLATQIFRFSVSIVLARLLLPEDFGLIGMTMVFIVFAQSLAEAGMGSAIVQADDIQEKACESILLLNVSIGCVLAIVLYFVAPLLSDFYNDDRVNNIAKALSVVFLLDSLGNVQYYLNQKRMNLKAISIANVMASVSSGVVALILAFLGYSYWSLVIQTILYSSVRSAGLWIGSAWRPRMQFSVESIGPLFNYGWKLFVSDIINRLYERVDYIIIGRLFSPATLGLYFRAITFNQYIIQYASSSIIAVLFPAFSEIKNDRIKVERLYRLSLSVVAFVAFGLSGLVYSSAESLVVVLFSEKWLPSVPYLRLIMLFSYAYPVSVIMVNMIAAMGNSKMFLQLEILKKGMLTIAIPIGFYFGIAGYLWTMVAVSFISVMVNISYVAKQVVTGMTWQIVMLAKYAIVSVAISGAITWLSSVLALSHLSTVVSNSLLFAAGYYYMCKVFRMTGPSIFIENFSRIRK